MKELYVGWMNYSKKGSIRATFLYIPLATTNVVDAAFMNVMSSMIPTIVTEIGLSRVDLLMPWTGRTVPWSRMEWRVASLVDLRAP